MRRQLLPSFLLLALALFPTRQAQGQPRFTGRKVKRRSVPPSTVKTTTMDKNKEEESEEQEGNKQQADTWFTQASAVPVYPLSDTAVASSPPSWPLAFGGIKATYQNDLLQDGPQHPMVVEMLAYARQKGVFVSYRGEPSSNSTDKQAVCTYRHSVAIDAATGGAEDDTVLSCTVEEEEEEEEEEKDKLKVVGMRRLECEAVEDGPLGEQTLWEVAFTPPGETEVKQGWWKPSIGAHFFLELQEGEVRHHLTIATDSKDQFSLMQHSRTSTTTQEEAKKEEEEDEKQDKTQQQRPPLPPLPPLSFLSYNIWHNQPASWFAPDPRHRWEMYWKRLSFLAKTIWETGADVVGLQEMRYDAFFGPAGYHSQMEHLVDLLAALDAKEAKEDKDDTNKTQNTRHGYSHAPFQFVYQPAMSFAKQQGGSPHQPLREEEGVALLSRFPIRRTSYLLLPRDYTDPEDGHQRICLRAVVEPAGPHGPLVDVYVTHFSLSARMRERAAASILDWATSSRNQEGDPDRPQILLGDLNAEPHEASLQLLTAEEVGFRDAWVETHPPLVSDEQEDDLVGQGQEEEDEQEKKKRRKKAKKARARRKRKELLASYTFPTCNPVKRIDYVLYRGFPLPPAEVRRCGLEATEDTKNLPSPGGGMLEPGGPVFASDHMGLLAEFGL